MIKTSMIAILSLASYSALAQDVQPEPTRSPNLPPPQYVQPAVNVSGPSIDPKALHIDELNHRKRIIEVERQIEEQRVLAELEEQKARKAAAEIKQERAEVDLQAARAELEHGRVGISTTGADGLITRAELLAMLETQRANILAATAASRALPANQQPAQSLEGLPALVGVLSDGRAMLQEPDTSQVFTVLEGDVVQDYVVTEISATRLMLRSDKETKTLILGR